MGFSYGNARALSGNPVISVMVSWMYNNAKDVKTEIDNTLRVSAPLRPCVKLENNNPTLSHYRQINSGRWHDLKPFGKQNQRQSPEWVVNLTK